MHRFIVLVDHPCTNWLTEPEYAVLTFADVNLSELSPASYVGALTVHSILSGKSSSVYSDGADRAETSSAPDQGDGEIVRLNDSIERD